MQGTVKSINKSEKKGTVKSPVEMARFIADFGIEGDAHAGKWHRQVSLLAQESIDSMKENAAPGAESLCSGIFAENITTEGLVLYTLPVGTKLKIGSTVQEITQIGKECHEGCEIQKLVGQCVMPRQGIFARVLSGGDVRVGDAIEVLEEKA
jgi:MOSC domain-containing protein YiiM